MSTKLPASRLSLRAPSSANHAATVVAGQVVRYVPPILTVSTNDSTREFSTLNSAYPGGILTWTDGGILTNRAVHRLILDTSNNGGTIDLGLICGQLCRNRVNFGELIARDR